ncbi:TrbC/VirB2 family protein [Lelliottia sp. V89_10]|uniref:TrbC/VirB2 family protein n=1 Tax=Lelliottia wanjuensis TaxID=3050585 RepID=UPI00249DE9BD|nr:MULTISPECIES: TrbC/VirB2 family protein [unclassified Lelliottia]MDI3360315.1 TrbC/VirB2 family protein [Lelliottia sp. V89_13]MDK9549459.1 TrbC/VirB2 family protein [Lelliottia sp. V89_5]MDK9596126.1 TrbC/VirB2 family protein [Lelliottia sp. V89_10]
MKFIKSIKNLSNKATTALLLSAAAQPAFAGFSVAENLLTQLESGLEGLAIITITIAVLWVGYKVLWNGQNLKDCSNIMIGGILIASASEIGSLLAGAYA